ncbi:cathepsin O [Sergentomyia squamirostris]
MDTKKFIIIFLGILCLFFMVPVYQNPTSHIAGEYERFVATYDRPYRYNPEEYQTRFLVFEKSMVRLKTMNESVWRYSGAATYGVTNFTDLSVEEFKRNHLATYKQNSVKNVNVKSKIRREDLPRSWDWRSKGFVTTVKDQGVCGACWAYSVLGVVETMVAKANGRMAHDLSMQQIFDCIGDRNLGCKGGDFVELLEFLIDENISLQEERFYRTSPLGNCSRSGKLGNRVKEFRCGNFVDNEDEILNLLANHGPLVAAINGLTWQNYLSGVIQHHCDGDMTELNHVVEIVGYNLTHEIPHYIVRNSWGKRFGENGYLRIAIGKNLCGIAQRVAAIFIE